MGRKIKFFMHWDFTVPCISNWITTNPSARNSRRLCNCVYVHIKEIISQMRRLCVTRSRKRAPRRRGNDRHVFLNISISRAEHGALLNCLRLRLFMTAVPALLFSKHFCSRWVLTEQSGCSSAAGQEKTARTAQLLPKTATKQGQLCVLCFDYARSLDLWFKMLQLPQSDDTGALWLPSNRFFTCYQGYLPDG